MTLSVCSFTDVPGSVLAVSLEPLREIADEIVIAYDSSADPGTIGPVMDIADRVYRVEVAPPFLERVLGWLLAQCRGTWIFRIDGDEVPSSELVASLASVGGDDSDVGQYLMPRRWLFPDPGRWITSDPWSPDYQARLTRNLPEYTEVEGVTHSNVVLTENHQFLEAPLYHTACLTTPRAERESRAAMYEELRPGLRTASGASLMSFYLPERAKDVATAAVAPEDADLVRRVIRTEPAIGAASELPVVPLAMIDDYWPGRQLVEDDYNSRLVVRDAPPTAASGATIEVLVEVTNLSPRMWHRSKGLSLGARWRRGDSFLPLEFRSRLPAAVSAGGSLLVPIEVAIADDHEVSDVLCLDMVDDGVRWFGQGLEITFD